MLQRLTKKAFGGFPISSASHKNIDHVPILIDCSPQVVPLASDLYEQFIDMPNVAEPPLLPSQISSVGWTELQTPISNFLVRNNDASLGGQVFYVSKAQGELMV